MNNVEAYAAARTGAAVEHGVIVVVHVRNGVFAHCTHHHGTYYQPFLEFAPESDDYLVWEVSRCGPEQTEALRRKAEVELYKLQPPATVKPDDWNVQLRALLAARDATDRGELTRYDPAALLMLVRAARRLNSTAEDEALEAALRPFADFT